MILNQLHTFLLSGFLWMQPLHAPSPPHHGNHAAGKPRRSGPAIIVDGKISRQMPFKDAISCLLSCSSAGNGGMVQLRWRLNALVFFFFCLNKINGAWLITYDNNVYTYIQEYKTWDWNRYLTHFFKVNQVHSMPCILIPVFNIAIAKTWNSFEFSNMETINHA